METPLITPEQLTKLLFDGLIEHSKDGGYVLTARGRETLQLQRKEVLDASNHHVPHLPTTHNSL